MSSNGSASDSANVNVVRNPKVYAEPINLSVKGMFHFKIERAGGLVEEFTSPNLVTRYGLEQLLTGIATTSGTNNFVSAGGSYTSRKCGLFLSTTTRGGSANGVHGANGVDLADSTGDGGTAYCGASGSVTNTAAATGFSEVLDSSGNLLYMLGDGSTGTNSVFGTTAVAAGSTAVRRKVVTAGVKVDASGGSGDIVTAGICIGDLAAATPAPADVKVFCAATISTVTLTNGDSLTTTYTLELA